MNFCRQAVLHNFYQLMKSKGFTEDEKRLYNDWSCSMHFSKLSCSPWELQNVFFLWRFCWHECSGTRLMGDQSSSHQSLSLCGWCGHPRGHLLSRWYNPTGASIQNGIVVLCSSARLWPKCWLWHPCSISSEGPHWSWPFLLIPCGSHLAFSHFGVEVTEDQFVFIWDAAGFLPPTWYPTRSHQKCSYKEQHPYTCLTAGT